MAKSLPIYQVDAFSTRPFGGNPAAVMPLDSWLPDDLLQAIAAENNLSETAYVVATPGGPDGDYAIRWFTPGHEVNLCGHATLASAWVLRHHLGWEEDLLRFSSRSGTLKARFEGEQIQLDFPARPMAPATPPQALLEALGCVPEQVLHGSNWMAVFPTAEDVAALRPDFRRLADLHPDGLIATAPGEDCDFVSRYFVPSFGIDEDPVTGSAHCDLTPYWSARLGRSHMQARQISARGGELEVRLSADGHRVLLSGVCQPYMEGLVLLP